MVRNATRMAYLYNSVRIRSFWWDKKQENICSLHQKAFRNIFHLSRVHVSWYHHNDLLLVSSSYAILVNPAIRPTHAFSRFTLLCLCPFFLGHCFSERISLQDLSIFSLRKHHEGLSRFVGVVELATMGVCDVLLSRRRFWLQRWDCNDDMCFVGCVGFSTRL